MVQLLLGLDAVPTPHDAADALAVAICHAHASGGIHAGSVVRATRQERSWRHVKMADLARRQAP
jgi:crossover junction endodeoxyribonuclease RuvC